MYEEVRNTLEAKGQKLKKVKQKRSDSAVAMALLKQQYEEASEQIEGLNKNIQHLLMEKEEREAAKAVEEAPKDQGTEEVK